jgi:VWFA-related protein
MTRFLQFAHIATISLLALTLIPYALAQVESNVPEAGFSPPPASAPPVAAPTGIALPGDSSAPTIHVYSRETIFDVLVSDSKGNPVHGLTRNDFTIFEDGQPISIRGFSENSTTLVPPEAVLPPDTYSNANTLPRNGPVQIILIQRAVTTIRSTGQRGISVPPGLLDYLHNMPLGTEVAVFTFSPITALQLVQGFTSDGNAAADAASRISPDVDLAPAYRGTTTTMQQIAALDQIAAYVAGIRGRKNLIWFYSGAPPVMLTRDGGYGWMSANGHDMTVVHRLMDAYETFSREQIAVYPIDPNGVHGLGAATLRSQDVADQTGGTLGNTNDIQAEMVSIVDRSSDFYTLSFVPPRPNEDAHFHSIKVLLNRPGLTLTYRTGYDDDHPRPPDRMLKADLLPAPMRIGALPATQLIFTVKVAPATPEERHAAAAAPVHVTDPHHAGSPKDPLYEVAFRFNPTQVVFTEDPGGKRTAKLEFDLGAYNSSSQLGPVRSQSITLTVKPSGYDDFMRKPFEFKLPIPIPAGQRILRAGLFDTVSGKAGTLQIPLTMPKQ